MSSEAYERAGVRGQGDALATIARHLGPTLTLPDAELMTTFGGYASVLKLSDEIAIALTTDGVGSKTIVASALNRYDTIGFDCVAMNVNDVICVGATPIAMVDYLAVNTLDAGRTDQILEGLGGAAKEAGVAIPGGELAQLPEIIGSDGRIQGDATAFDLAGACVGVVHPERLITGGAVEAGDALIGIASSGIHSNGLTLARRVLLRDAGYELHDYLGRLGRTIGEELLEPTRIYVRAARTLWDAGIETRGLVHITGDGFANLARLEADAGYVVEELPRAPAIFGLIKDAGNVDDAEMFRVFNMGIGFVVIVPETAVGDTIACVHSAGYDAMRIGTVTTESGVVRIEPVGLVGGMNAGDSTFRRP
ncbi:MAG: phosphoribosylformylglycinamidine cyclo-ligase [Actinomycetota bacterium]